MEKGPYTRKDGSYYSQVTNATINLDYYINKLRVFDVNFLENVMVN